MSHATDAHQDNLNRLLDSAFESCLCKIRDAQYDLDNPAFGGNASATPEYVLLIVEKALTLTSDFTQTMETFVIHANMGSDQHTSLIKQSSAMADAIVQVMQNMKGVSRLASNDETAEDIISNTKTMAKMSEHFLDSLVTTNLTLMAPDDKARLVREGHDDVNNALQYISGLVESLATQAPATNTSDDLGDIVEREMLAAAQAISDATTRLESLLGQAPREGQSERDLSVHSAILDAAMVITRAISTLIKAATASQQEIVAHGRGNASTKAFYKKHHRWTEGLISAAKAVALATNGLVESADGVLAGTHKMEQLIVASHAVAAATAQLVAAARVKAIPGSKTQDRLEAAAAAVTDATKLLVKAAERASTQERDHDTAAADLSKLTIHDFKVAEMNQQVEILTLERHLTAARKRLAEMRKSSYHHAM